MTARATVLVCLLATAAGCTTNVYQLAVDTPDTAAPVDARADTRVGVSAPEVGADAAEAETDAVDVGDAAESGAPDAAPESAPDAVADAVDVPATPPTQQQMCDAYTYPRPPPTTEWVAVGPACLTMPAVGDPFRCEFMAASDGITRCLPPIAHVIGWANPACSPFDVGLTDLNATYARATLVVGGANVVHAAQVVSPPAVWYRIDASGACVQASDPWPGGAFTTTEILQPSQFVAYPHH